MPSIPGFVGGSYKLATDNASADRAINIYTESIEKGPRAGSQRLIGIPGLRLFATLPSGPIRALFSGDNRLFCVAGDTLWEVIQGTTTNFSNTIAATISALRIGAPVSGNGIPAGSTITAFTSTSVTLSHSITLPPNTALVFAVNNGNVGPATNPAIIVSNGFQLCVASGGRLYLAPGNTPAYPLIDTEGEPVACASVAFQDQYFIGAFVDSKTVIISNLAPDGGTWDPGNEAEKEGYSDNISRVWVDDPGGEYLWLFGNDTTEVWMDTGGLFPFTRVQGMVFPIGCDSTWSVAGVEGQRFWLWRGIVWSATGFQPVRISDFGVETAIASYSYSDQSNAEAFCYFDGGHLFYVLSFPESGATWVYDATTQSWHERWYIYNGQFNRYRPRVYAKFEGMHIVGDYASSALFIMDSNVFTDAPTVANLTGPGVPLIRQRVCPYFTEDMNNTRFARLTIDMETGVGLNVAPGQPGYDPQVYMRYSRNRGYTWSSYIQRSAGKQGDYDIRVIYTQLGSNRIGMVFDVNMSDPVPFNINNAYIDTEPGT